MTYFASDILHHCFNRLNLAASKHKHLHTCTAGHKAFGSIVFSLPWEEAFSANRHPPSITHFIHHKFIAKPSLGTKHWNTWLQTTKPKHVHKIHGGKNIAGPGGSRDFPHVHTQSLLCAVFHCINTSGPKLKQNKPTTTSFKKTNFLHLLF